MERASYDWSEDSIRLTSTPSPLAKSIFFYVEEVGYFKTKPLYFTERAHLNSFLMVYTLSGKGALNYKGKSYTLSKGQMFFIDCMEYHYYETDKTELWEILWVHFNGAASRGYYEAFYENAPPIIDLGDNTIIAEYMKQLITNHKRVDIPVELINSNIIVNLLTDLIVITKMQNTASNSFPKYIQLIIKFIDNCFNEKISLDLLAQKFAVSKFHLAKEFKRYTGFSPNEYLINTRINYSKELLQYTNLSISEISEKVGIPNTSHFIKLFKFRTELTPLSYRTRWKLNSTK